MESTTQNEWTWQIFYDRVNVNKVFTIRDAFPPHMDIMEDFPFQLMKQLRRIFLIEL